MFWPWSSFNMSAWTVPRTLARTKARTSAASSAVGGRPCSAANCSILWSMAVFRNIARMVGAGPLIVIDTEVAGWHRSNPSKSAFISSRVATDTPEVPILP